MEISELLKAVDIIDANAKPLGEVTNLAYHSSKVGDGTLFFCIRGYKTDGHLFLREASEKGAMGAIVENFNDHISLPQYKVADSRAAMAALADKFYDYPSHKLDISGVTATNGKTTTTYMANEIFTEHGFKTGLIGTVIIKTGKETIPADLTTPESLDLQRYLHDMVEENVTHVVMEVSSSGLELKRVSNVNFDLVVVNNISREHIDLHGSFDNYYHIKAGLVRNASKHQWAIINGDCPYSAPLAHETRAKVITYGLKNKDTDINVCNLDLTTGRASYTVKLNKSRLPQRFNNYPHTFSVKLTVLGLHSVDNAMGATLIALLHDIPVDTIRKALLNFRGVERRFELLFDHDIKILDDHFANSGNIHVTMETLSKMEYKNLHMVYAIRGSRGVTVNMENCNAITHWFPLLRMAKVIVTTSTAHVTEKDIVTEAEIEVFKEAMGKADVSYELHSELPDAIASALKSAAPGDVVLLAGCQGMDYGATVCLNQIAALYPHLDKELVFKALKNRVAGI